MIEGFAPDIQVDWVTMARNTLRYNVVIVGKFFNKGSWVSEAWRREHPEGFEEDPESVPERIPTAEERREELHLDTDLVGVVCAALGHATSTQCSVDVLWKGET